MRESDFDFRLRTVTHGEGTETAVEIAGSYSEPPVPYDAAATARVVSCRLGRRSSPGRPGFERIPREGYIVTTSVSRRTLLSTRRKRPARSIRCFGSFFVKFSSQFGAIGNIPPVGPSGAAVSSFYYCPYCYPRMWPCPPIRFVTA